MKKKSKSACDTNRKTTRLDRPWSPWRFDLQMILISQVGARVCEFVFPVRGPRNDRPLRPSGASGLRDPDEFPWFHLSERIKTIAHLIKSLVYAVKSLIYAVKSLANSQKLIFHERGQVLDSRDFLQFLFHSRTIIPLGKNPYQSFFFKPQ